MGYFCYPEGFFVSRRALRKVKDKLEPPTSCRYCQGEISLVRHSEIYNGKEFGDWPFAYLCRGCGAYVGVHPFTDVPLGILANKELREVKKAEKRHFEDLRLMGVLGSRKEAYAWLADQLGINVNECHWGWFDVDMCKQAGTICRELMEKQKA